MPTKKVTKPEVRSGYIKYECRLCKSIFIVEEEFEEDVIDAAWRIYDIGGSTLPTFHCCTSRKRGLAEMVGYIKCLKDGK